MSSNDYDELQEMVLEDARRTYTEKVIDLFMNPRNIGLMPDTNGYARITGSCGDTMEIFVRIEDGILKKVSFLTDGCGSSLAAGSMATILAKNKTVAIAGSISQKDILDALGGLPDENKHCALLASDTLKAAISNYFERQNG
jgi:nitrogen fixation protein NifU and related proteins